MKTRISIGKKRLKNRAFWPSQKQRNFLRRFTLKMGHHRATAEEYFRGSTGPPPLLPPCNSLPPDRGLPLSPNGVIIKKEEGCGGTPLPPSGGAWRPLGQLRCTVCGVPFAQHTPLHLSRCLNHTIEHAEE